MSPALGEMGCEMQIKAAGVSRRVMRSYGRRDGDEPVDSGGVLELCV